MIRRRQLVFWLTLTFLLVWGDAAQAQDRTFVIVSLVVEKGDTATNVTCYFCSVRILGEAQGGVTSIGGSVEVDGAVTGDVIAVGGDVWLGPAAQVGGDAVAVGGYVQGHAQATLRGDDTPVSLPWFFLPGQRHFAWRGILALAAFYVLPATLFAALLRARRLERLADATRTWYAAIPAGILLLAAFYFTFTFADHFGRWADWVDYGLATVLLILLGAGFAGLAYAAGGLFLPRTTVASVAMGTALLIALQVIPIAGFVVFLFVVVLALGSAAWSGLGFRGSRPPPLRPYPPPSSRPAGRGPLDLFPR